ncbi:Plus-3 like protein [Cordyceps fumosorosea ARSEF 2679]|uniref:Plus-3 like protein n=1 Tax=Cordyceps fumosorosea (strain ARSEF 2679) TaxID=1081104 RepID=A0A167QJG5_CORFA|nr:Plus-3 like protein [Cordyceps fumosorosea ARSEF 2679]OAA57697.1 Plus-3 like protein [Cordyceps fumosorosea ARSEF 2679]
MADFEADLFDLAGGDSDSEGSVVDDRRRSASPAKRGSKTKNSRHDADGESEEEGEAFSGPGSPNSLDSAPMDESDSDDEQPRARGSGGARGGSDEEKYPVDGKFRDEAEKAEIMAMPELKREQILADRANEIERLRQNRLLRQMVTDTQNDERKAGKKRSADSADLDGDEDDEDSAATRGKSSRHGAGGGTAMDALRRARADRQKRREDHERRRDAYSPRRDLDDEASEDGYRRGGSRTPDKEEKKDEPKPELRDFERVRLGRNEFAQVCFTPGFESAITGCFIRIALGPHPETGVEQYRMAIIKGFTTGRPYALSGPNGTFVTDQYVKAGHGKAIKEFPFIAASSGKFTENEMNRYQITCHNENVKTPLKVALNSKVDQINGLLTHNWTNEEIKARLARRNELRKRFDPAERERVARLLEEATVAGDEERMSTLQEELDKLGTQRLAFKTSLGLSKSSSAYDGGAAKMSTEQDRLAARNKENRRLNQEAVRRAQLREKARAREIEMSLSRGEMVQEDPSRRLRTKAKFVHDVNESGPEAGSKPGSGVSTPTTSAAAAPVNGAAKLLPHLVKLQDRKQAEDGKGLPTIHKPLMDDDVIGSLDLDIDIDI